MRLLIHLANDGYSDAEYVEWKARHDHANNIDGRYFKDIQNCNAEVVPTPTTLKTTLFWVYNAEKTHYTSNRWSRNSLILIEPIGVFVYILERGSPKRKIIFLTRDIKTA